MMTTSAVKNMNAPKRDNLKVHTSSNVFSLKNESLYFERIFFQKMRDLFFLCILRHSEVLYTAILQINYDNSKNDDFVNKRERYICRDFILSI